MSRLAARRPETDSFGRQFEKNWVLTRLEAISIHVICAVTSNNSFTAFFIISSACITKFINDKCRCLTDDRRCHSMPCIETEELKRSIGSYMQILMDITNVMSDLALPPSHVILQTTPFHLLYANPLGSINTPTTAPKTKFGGESWGLTRRTNIEYQGIINGPRMHPMQLQTLYPSVGLLMQNIG